MPRNLIYPTLALILAACGAKPDAGANADSAAAAPPAVAPAGPAADVIPTTTFAPALGVDVATMTKTATGLYYKDLVVGTGAEATIGTTASLNYVGTLPDGTQFDASNGRPYSFRIGDKRVIQGWDDGVPGMKVGGKRLLVIPSEQGYGANGSGPIPPNAVLVFSLELVTVQ